MAYSWNLVVVSQWTAEVSELAALICGGHVLVWRFVSASGNDNLAEETSVQQCLLVCKGSR